MEWISINEELPIIDKDVLLFTDSGIIEGSRSDGEYDNWNFITLDIHGCGCCGRDSDEVTHWAILPRQPK